MLKNIRNKLTTKGIPKSLIELKCVNCSYSQFGEDIYLSHLFGKDMKSGTYVDVGCYEPIQYSNTYLFYKRGWNGLCIDPNPRLSAKWSKHRPRDNFINLGVGKDAAELGYMEHIKYPALNFLFDPHSEPAELHDPNFSSTKTINTNTLFEILEHNAVIKDFDFLNIDCEGMDLEVLESMKLERHRPRVICIEDRNKPLHGKIHQILNDQGYSFSASIGISKVYTDTSDH